MLPEREGHRQAAQPRPGGDDPDAELHVVRVQRGHHQPVQVQEVHQQHPDRHQAAARGGLRLMFRDSSRAKGMTKWQMISATPTGAQSPVMRTV